MKIGEIAQQARVSKSLIRYYEGKGILPPATRDSHGYRNYGEADLARIQMIVTARRLGCTFKEIQALVETRFELDGTRSAQLLELITEKMATAGDEIDRLERIRQHLSWLHDLVAEPGAG